MARKADPLFAKLAKVDGRRGPKSKLAVWMRENREDYAALLARRGAAWDADAALFVEDGLLPKPEKWDDPGPDGDVARARVANTAKQTWHRVKTGGFRNRKPKKAAPLSMASEKPIVGPDPTMSALQGGQIPDEVVQRRMANAQKEQKGRSG